MPRVKTDPLAQKTSRLNILNTHKRQGTFVPLIEMERCAFFCIAPLFASREGESMKYIKCTISYYTKRGKLKTIKCKHHKAAFDLAKKLKLSEFDINSIRYINI